MSFPIRPQNDKLIVRPQKMKERVSSGGIIEGKTAADLEEGMVVAVSPKIQESYNLGEIVTYPKESGKGLIANGEPHLWLTEGDIWGILEGE